MSVSATRTTRAGRFSFNMVLSFYFRHCEERSDEAIQSFLVASGLLRGACHRAALRADPLARNDGLVCGVISFAYLVRIGAAFPPPRLSPAAFCRLPVGRR